jgi:hypothetical protein
MRQWEIYFLDLPKLGSHPVVVISPDWVCLNASIVAVNVLLCSSVRTGDSLGEYETGLDASEGLQHLTGCQCHALLLIMKLRFEGKVLAGTVSHERRRDIRRKIKAAFGFF